MGMRYLPRLFTEWVPRMCKNVRWEEDYDASRGGGSSMMFTYVVRATDDEKDKVIKMRGAAEVLGLCLGACGTWDEEDDIFVRMMLTGVIVVGVVLFCIRRFDVV